MPPLSSLNIFPLSFRFSATARQQRKDARKTGVPMMFYMRTPYEICGSPAHPPSDVMPADAMPRFHATPLSQYYTRHHPAKAIVHCLSTRHVAYYAAVRD